MFFLPSLYHRKSCRRKSMQGFTLVELVTVIVILGILAIMATAFVRFATQIYIDSSNRDELTASARFTMERLNREFRTALPNSIRVTTSGGRQCIEYVPVEASVVYIDIPVFPESASNSVNIVSGNSDLDDISLNKVIVYGLNSTEIYGTSNKTQVVSAITETIATTTGHEFTLTLSGSVHFAEDSPTKRLFFINDPVSYCLEDTQTGINLTHTESLTRHTGYGYDGNSMADNAGVVMANFVRIEGDSGGYNFPFTVTEATQTRNSIVLANFKFSRNSENIYFNNEMQVPNVP